MTVIKRAIFALLSATVQAISNLFVTAHYIIMARPALSATTALVSVITISAAHNALYSQSEMHPAPLFESHTASLQDAKHHTRAMPQLANIPNPPLRALFVPNTPTGTALNNPYIDIDQTLNATAKKDKKTDLIALQTMLKNKGFYTGKVDGIMGPNTRKAIAAYEQSKHSAELQMVSQPQINEQVIPAIQVSAAPLTQPAPTQTSAHDIETQIWGQELILQIENAFFERGLLSVTPDGQSDSALNAAIKSYEKSKNWPLTGRITARLLEDLAVSPL